MDGDAELVARVRRGDRQAFDDLYERYADDVFSMCLVILGDPSVARAAAGTAFALVARTRMNPLSDPTRLRSWLLELARGSALAWSGSPQARSVPVPHGVSAEEMIEGAIVPAPASLRAGLARTFDRAAGVATGELPVLGGAAQVPAQPTVAATVTPPAARPAHAGAAVSAPGDGAGLRVVAETGGKATATPPVDLTKRAEEDPDEPTRQVPVAPGGHHYYADGQGAPLIPIGAAGASRHRNADWRTRPAVAVAASLVVAVAGITAALNWPAPSADPATAEFPDVAIVAPSLPVSQAATTFAAAPSLSPTTTVPTTAYIPRPVRPVLPVIHPASPPVPSTAPAPTQPTTSPGTPTHSPSSPSTSAPTTSGRPPTHPSPTRSTKPTTTPTTGPSSPVPTSPTDGGAPTSPVPTGSSTTPASPTASATATPTVPRDTTGLPPSPVTATV